MLLSKLQQLMQRNIRAKRLGIKFNRVASFQLPDNLLVKGKRHQVKVPSEKGMDGEFIEVLLDDCYGVEQLPPSLRTIIDIGANVGLFPIAARNRFPQAVIHAYEANPNLENYLKHQSEIANFTYFMEALGDRDGKVVLDIREVSGKTRSRVSENGDVPMVSLKRAIDRIGGSVDLAKVDCEGAEWLLFEDRDTWQLVQNLSLEYHLWSGHTHAETRQVIENLGFEVRKQTPIDKWYGSILASRIPNLK
ncbi:MAG: FkbM family methyltransferase [Microcoleus sp. PH2017_10_PVI_O_A]|uniref:FkbM family methyltransferase n=1 Tax=unclassified Microcoleus TaxID=2642155 RepID=UPI001D6E20CB|nr:MULTISPECIES: FkbM family methyltransferase [unclassified Microcoleus]TAE76921.1 MAG: FkbM family methyltransferase [Oscillatoriales cyanobacterium]MCC3405682.1 FkbM family methyltransferase [Microcoleus sp. PH2017_10_PVI_O_A]MCC3463394.1 FkbM family methyltransferase [Microcoleus sp. PH2017_11_PCY_U_A]MCC3478147.1 FkbM family methyltransferase [Microcoleus sp. PH2017_12_PCY_D_A]MCC3528138.1 FkbM family methyltransferase [Microcoleus sp. PH2017_21_RUC_O_A]